MNSHIHKSVDSHVQPLSIEFVNSNFFLWNCGIKWQNGGHVETKYPTDFGNGPHIIVEMKLGWAKGFTSLAGLDSDNLVDPHKIQVN